MDRKVKKALSKNKLEVTMYYGYDRNKFKEKYKVEKAPKTEKDNILRFEIHRKISSYIKEGKSKEEILSELSKEERYINYLSYIPNWIDDRIKKNGSFDRSFNKFI